MNANVADALRIALSKLNLDPKELKSTLISYENGDRAGVFEKPSERLELALNQMDVALQKRGSSLEEFKEKFKSENQRAGWLFTFETCGLELLIRLKVYEDNGEVEVMRTLH